MQGAYNTVSQSSVTNTSGWGADINGYSDTLSASYVYSPNYYAGLVQGTYNTVTQSTFTTGSTLNSCARALRQAGCPSLDVVTFARG